MYTLILSPEVLPEEVLPEVLPEEEVLQESKDSPFSTVPRREKYFSSIPVFFILTDFKF